MLLDFKEELAKIYMDTYEELDAKDYATKQKQKEEYERYRDIADGIIIL
jgi:hypothetical protein